MPKRENIIRFKKNYCRPSANSLAMITKHEVRINYIAEIDITSDAKKIKYYQIRKKNL